MGLRTRLQLLVLLPLVPALLLAIYANLGHQRSAALRVELDAIRLVQLAAAKQQAVIDSVRQHLEAIARLPDARGTNIPAFDGFFAAVIKFYKGYNDFGLIETNGDLVSCSFSRKGRTNVADRVHFQRVIKTNDFAVGEYQAGDDTVKPSLTFAYPVLDEKGGLARVLYAALDLSVLNKVAAKANLPESGTIRVHDRGGHVLARYPDPDKWLGKTLPESPDLAALMTKGEGSAELLGLDGISRLYAFTSIRSGPDPNLFVSVGIPTAFAYAETKRMLVRNLAIFGVVALLVMWSASLYGRVYILRPIKALVSATKKLASGNLTARTEVNRSSDELNQLVCAFNEMAQSLERQRVEKEGSEKAIRESEGRLQLILNTALDGVITMDSNGIILGWNPQAEKIFGWSGAEVVGQPLLAKVIPPADREAHERGLRRFLTTGEGPALNQRIEITALHKQGHQFPVELAITPIKTADCITFSAFVRDITERKRAEATLRRSEERFSRAFRASPAAMSIASFREGRFVDVNLSFLRATGHERDELIGRTSLEVGIWSNPADRTRLVAALREGTPVHNQAAKFRTKSGELRDALASAELIDLDGEQCILALLQDITDAKRAEARLTASLNEKDVLLKEIHHRVKNNLQFVSSLLNLQSNAIQDRAMLEILQESRDRIRTMALVHEKLYQSSDLAQIDFKQHIRDLASMVFRSYSPRSHVITLEVQVDPVFLAIEMAVPLSFILNEMVSNCLKHAFPEGREGTITIRFFQDSQDRLHLIVRDNGVGIPRDFTLADAGSLGLRLVQILTDQLDGNLTYHGNGGTEFEVTFGGQNQNARN